MEFLYFTDFYYTVVIPVTRHSNFDFKYANKLIVYIVQ